jgi:ABC-type Fe3+/spermidine/putrescine transport system ATPase subunit
VRSNDNTTPATVIDALLRPEDVSVEVDADAADMVIHKSFLGATTRLIVQVGEVQMRVDIRSDVAVDMDLGTRVRPSIIASDVLVAPRVASSPV